MSDIASQLDFVSDQMPIIGGIGRRFAAGRPFDALTVAVRIHVEPKTAVLVRTLRDGGARVIALGNKGTTNDELAELLRREDIVVLGDRADDDSTAFRLRSRSSPGMPPLSTSSHRRWPRELALRQLCSDPEGTDDRTNLARLDSP